MDEPAVAEIIGWKLVHDNDPWNGPLWLLPDDTGRWGQPTADDLLAWLAPRLPVVEMTFASGWGSASAAVYLKGEHHVHGTTLLEALGDAVRAVAAARVELAERFARVDQSRQELLDQIDVD